MSDVKEIFSGNKFPSFITSHNVFRTNKEVKKVFPEIGLPNTEKEIEVDNKEEARASAEALLNMIRHTLDERLRTINKYATKKEDMGKRRKKKLENVTKLLTDVKTEINKSGKNKFLIENNGRITINLPIDVADLEEKVAFKTGEGLFRVYNKLNDVLREGHFLAMTKLEDIQQFKDFSSKNVPALKYKVRFASDGSEGAWDIATMSMRGVSSCQSWGTSNSTHIVGSIVDPFTGIIYLTSGAKFNEHGTKMIRRCVVRFMVDEKNKTPFIALEHMYPSVERGALNAFLAFLKERTGNKFEVVYLPESRRITGSYVPMSKVVSSLNVNDQPYRDSGVQYKTDINTSARIKEEIGGKLAAICAQFAAKTVAGARAMKLSSVPEESKPAFKALRGNDYMWDSSYHLYEDLETFAKKAFGKTDQKKYTSNDAFMKDAIESFLGDSLEDSIFNVVKASAKKRIPKDLGKLHDDVAKDIAKISFAKITTYLNGELKKIKIVETRVKAKDPAEDMIPIYTKLLG